jgi:predicted kinase
MPRLVMLSGLPGSGKSTLGKRLAARTGAELLRIDLFEQTLRNQYGTAFEVGTLGYQRGYDLAAGHLSAGHNVIADAVNAVEAARQGWRDVAAKSGAVMVEVEIICTDAEEARTRLETRDTGIKGLAPVSYEAAMARPWEDNPHAGIRLDTAGQTPEESLTALLRFLSQPG